MPRYKEQKKAAVSLLRVCLALRLREIEKRFADYEQFVKRANVSTGTMYHLIRGTSNPTFATLEGIAKAFGLDPMELLGFDEADVENMLEKHGFKKDDLSRKVKRPGFSVDDIGDARRHRRVKVIGA